MPCLGATHNFLRHEREQASFKGKDRFHSCFGGHCSYGCNRLLNGNQL